MPLQQYLTVEHFTSVKLRWLTAALLSVSLAVWAAIWWWADMLQSKAITMLYASLDSTVSQELWDRGWNMLGDARKLNPLHAEYPFYQAYFSYNRMLESSEQQGNLPAYRSQTFNYFNQALRQRPHWGYVWAQLAETRLAIGDGGEETVNALEKVLMFAPYEPFALHITVRVGFAFWDRLDNELRHKLLAAVQYLLQHDPKFVIETALLFEWSEQLRPLLIRKRDIEHLDSRLADKRKHAVAD